MYTHRQKLIHLNCCEIRSGDYGLHAVLEFVFRVCTAINTRWILYIVINDFYYDRRYWTRLVIHNYFICRKNLLSRRVPSSCFRLPAGDRFRYILPSHEQFQCTRCKTKSGRLIIIIALRIYNMFTFRIRLKRYLQLGRFYCNPMV